MKQCSKCKKIKDFSEFYKRNENHFRSHCKKCFSEYTQRCEKRIKKVACIYYLKNKKRIDEKNKKWHKENKEKKREHQKRWRGKNKKYFNEYRKNRSKTDPKFRLDHSLSTAVNFSLKGNKSGRKWETLVGYTLQDLIQHLEKQFDDKMNWQNYGSYWHIDHRTPKSWFKYEIAEDEEFKKCWKLENLQPLEGGENYSKNNRFIS